MFQTSASKCQESESLPFPRPMLWVSGVSFQAAVWADWLTKCRCATA
jgi:hypothetical protein